MVQCPNRSIPHGAVKQYKPFWNETLNKLKTSRETFRLLAERTGQPHDAQAWRKQCAEFKREILKAKRECFNNFLSNINYQQDSART